jgi:SAM-dependent methyltransferase
MGALSDEEQNLRLMKGLDNYSRWQFESISPFLQGDVLEVGGGVGTITNMILKHPGVTSVSVTEINKNNIMSLRDSFSKSLKIISDANLENLVPPDFSGAFDTVLSVNVLEHVKDDQAMFRNCCRCLRKGGRLVLFVPAMHSIYGVVDEAVNHYRRYEKKDLTALAEDNGLALRKMRYMNMAGAIGWFYQGRVVKSRIHKAGELGLFDRVVPALKFVESIIPPPLGLSLVFVGEKQ